jgi:hypothetical protein
MIFFLKEAVVLLIPLTTASLKKPSIKHPRFKKYLESD